MELDPDKWPHLNTIAVMSGSPEKGSTEVEMDLGDFTESFRIPECPGIPEGGLRIKRITIQGFGPYYDRCTIDPGDGLNIISGVNGAGKTTIFKAVNWCFTGFPTYSDPWDGDQGRMHGLMNWDLEDEGKGEIVVKVDFIFGDKIYTVERRMSADGKKLKVSMKNREGQVKNAVLPSGIRPDSLPFLLFQGESILFLSQEDPFSNEGPLKKALLAISGSAAMKDNLDLWRAARQDLVDLLVNNTRISSPRENKLSSLKDSRRQIESELARKKKVISDLESRIEKERQEYHAALRTISSMPRDRSIRDLVARASRASSYASEIEKMLGDAPVEMLRGLAEESLDKAVTELNEITETRLRYGALEAQLEIVNEVIRKNRCICGSKLGTTGMGRRNLEALHGRIKDRQLEVSSWKEQKPWISRKNIDMTNRLLATKGKGRDHYSALLRKYRESKEAALILKKAGSHQSDEVRSSLNAIRRYESLRSKMSMERDRLRRLNNRMRSVDDEICHLEGELIEIWGNEKGSAGIRERVSFMDSCISEGQEFIEVNLENYREELQREINSMLSRLDKGSDLGKVKVTPGTFRLVRERKGKKAIELPLNSLSAGEREITAIAVIMALNRICSGMLMIDSPFQFLDSRKKGSILAEIGRSVESAMISLPEGSLTGKQMERLYAASQKDGFVIFEVEKRRGRSIVRKIDPEGGLK